MKKIKKFVCWLLLVAVLPIGLVACSGDEPESPTSIIALAEAKAMIMRALALDSVTAQATSSNADQGNRDVLEKLGKFSYEENDWSYDYYDAKIIPGAHCQGHAEYQNYQYQTYFIAQDNAAYGRYEEYLIDNKIYRRSDNRITVENNEQPTVVYGNRFSALTRALFGEQAFAVYQNAVDKTRTDVGYDLALKMVWDDFYWYLDGVFNPDRDLDQRLVDFEKAKTNLRKNCPFYAEMQMTTKVSFTNDQIVAVEFTAVMHAARALPEGSEVDPARAWVKSVATIKIKADAQAVTEPAWFTTYKAQS